MAMSEPPRSGIRLAPEKHTPLSLLPFQIARAVWMLINLALWLFGLIRLQQMLGFPRPGWRGWLVHLLATFIFAWTTWKFEQIGILLFVIAVELLIAYQKRQWIGLGIFLALALIKPNVMSIPVAAIGVWLVRRQIRRPVITGLARAGYAVRHLPGQGLPQGLRITIGTAEQMAQIAAALREMAG